MSRRLLGTMKILLGTQGGRLLTGENKPTLMPIRRLGPTVVNFYPMIITPPMMRIWRNLPKLELSQNLLALCSNGLEVPCQHVQTPDANSLVCVQFQVASLCQA